MQAIRIHTTGDADALRLDSVPRPVCGPDQALVKIEAAGVNFIDVYQRSGLYPIPLPATLGQEGAGTVEAVGENVTELRVGDRVAYASVLGAYAEYAVVPAARLVRLPDGVEAREGAAAMLQGLTAHYLATSTFPLEPGDRCLVHAAAGGVGLLLVQIAKLLGAFVIGTVSTEEKSQLATEAGADEVIRYTEQDFVAETRRITDGEGVSVVYDSVGRTTFARGLEVIAPRGMMVLFGASSGPVSPLDPQALNRAGSLFLTRPNLAHYVATREELTARADELFGWIVSRAVRLRIERELPLADAATAHRELEGRRTTGKVLLVP
jgi:NADPH2:quinone reductase